MQALLKPDEKAEELEALKQALQINPVTGISDDYKNNLQSVLSYLELMALGIFLDVPVLPTYQQYVAHKIKKYSENWLHDWHIQLWEQLFITPDDMESLYHQECNEQKVSELDYLVMRLTDTMQDMEVAITRLREKYKTASQEEFDHKLWELIDESKQSLNNIITSIIRRYFPEANFWQVVRQARDTILHIVK